MKSRKERRAGSEASLAADAVRLSDAVWDFAEQPFREHRSSEAIRKLLLAKGFRIERRFRSIPTAFVMSFGASSPRIGIMAEYDALPDCGLRKGTWGHGCGHNILGAGSALAAMIVADALRAARKPRGTICLIGCPAEETLAGKAYMARDGAFRGFDAILAWHPSSGNCVSRLGGSAMDSLAFEFFGRTAHGAHAEGGRSALDAVEIMDHAVNVLREHIPEHVRIHSVVSEGGTMPNVVPAYARSWYYVRGANRKEVDEVTARVVRCARGAAIATETRMKSTLLAGIYDRLPNDAMVAHLQRCFTRIGPPRFDRKDEKALKALGLKGEFVRKIGNVARTQERASSDEDTVSWLAPLGRISVACFAKGPRGHHRDLTKQGKAQFAHKGLIQAGRILGLAALGLLRNRRLLARVRSEFRRRTRGFRFNPIVPRGQLPPDRDRIPKRMTRPD